MPDFEIFTSEEIPAFDFFESNFEVTGWSFNVVAVESTSGVVIDFGKETEELEKIVLDLDNPSAIVVTPAGNILNVNYIPDGSLFPLQYVDYQDQDERTIIRELGIDAWDRVPDSSPNIIKMLEDRKSSSKWAVIATAIDLDPPPGEIPETQDFLGEITVFANYSINKVILLNEVEKRR